MALRRFVSVPTVADLLKKRFINENGIRILDCSYSVSQKPDWKGFEQELFGKFDLLQNAPSQSKQLYMSGHIPGAVHMNLDAAMYPSKYQRFSMYAPELFEKYVQMLGIHKKEHLILYSRGALGGMMFSAKCAWLFKSYGHDNVSVLDGGFAHWISSGQDVSTDDVVLPKGDWLAADTINKYNISFEELTEKDADGKELIDKTNDINFLDSRGRGQFNGSEDTGLDAYRVSGSFVPGFKNCPTYELLTNDGLIKSQEQIINWLLGNGFDETKPVITNCNTGMTASLLSYAIEDLVEATPRLYSGSLKELEVRAPKKICGGNIHFST